MATIINQPPAESEGWGLGFVAGLIIVIVLAILFFVYGLPQLREDRGGTNINVPDKIDIDVNRY